MGVQRYSCGSITGEVEGNVRERGMREVAVRYRACRGAVVEVWRAKWKGMCGRG